MELVAEIGGVRFVNDSKATNVEAALRVDRELRARVWCRSSAAGSRAAISRLLREPLQARGAGGRRDRRGAAAGARGARRTSSPVHDAATCASAVRTAFALAQPAGVVLLAPACASFDMFRDYAERGRVFKQEAMRLASGVERRA